METPRPVWWIGRWVVVALVLVSLFKLAVDVAGGAPGPHDIPFDRWYGHWREALTVSAVFLGFLLAFILPRRRVEWKNAGLSAAFFISLFTEMFGIPLTIYLLAPVLGLPVSAFGMNESHLWAFALERLGLLPLHAGVHVVMTVSIVLIVAGLGLLAVGWATVYWGRDRLVTDGIYRYLRHPQYLGLMLIILGFNIMWPTVLTLLMAPVLIVMYIRLARREDEELATLFGEAFRDYAARTSAFIPLGRGRSARALERTGTQPAREGMTPPLPWRRTVRWPERTTGVIENQDGQVRVRRNTLASLLAGAGAVGAMLWGWRPRATNGRGYHEVARWTIPAGEGRFIAVGPSPSAEELHAVGERLREEFGRLENGVVMIFDEPEAAREVRRGFRSIGEERFEAALRHQRAMYVKQRARGEHRLVIYSTYPAIQAEVRY